MSGFLEQPKLSPENYQLLYEVVAGLVADFGFRPVKQEINRRPRPRANGRPKEWDEHRLFSLWLIVQAWAIFSNGSISSGCEALSK